MRKLVSLIVPCYNGAEFVFRLLDSILGQTYSDIELLFIDDGSIDDTEKIVRSYLPKFNEKGYSLVYIYQENEGQASALNNGLKRFNGTYLSWPDSDDYYARNDAIEKMVNELERLPREYGIVRSDALLVDEDTMNVVKKFSYKFKINEKENLFHDCLRGKNGFCFIPACYMTKQVIVDEVIKQREIFCNRGGQNIQMFAPIFKKYKCQYIDIPLVSYLIRGDSHSREISDFETAFVRLYAQGEIYEETLKKIVVDENEYSSLLALVKEKICYQIFIQALLAQKYSIASIYRKKVNIQTADNFLKLHNVLRYYKRLIFRKQKTIS